MSRNRIVPSLIAALLALAPRGAHAQEGSQLTGTWTLNQGASDEIGPKINHSIARMNIFIRQIARARLQAVNTAYPQLIFDYGENVHVDMPGYISVSSPADGRPVLWHRKTGRSCPVLHGSCVEVTTTFENGRLVQTFRGGDGERQNIFTVAPDGTTLTMHATLTSPRLSEPLVYRLVYQRTL